MRWGMIIGGALAAAIGAVWFFQGIGILLGSVMTSQPFWAIAGGVTFVAGAAVLGLGLRRGQGKAGGEK